MKKIVSLLLVAAMVLGCTAAFAKEDGKITIWTWDPTFNIAAMNTAKEMYQKDHPDVEIEVIEKLSDDIETAVIAPTATLMFSLTFSCIRTTASRSSLQTILKTTLT